MTKEKKYFIWEMEEKKEKNGEYIGLVPENEHEPLIVIKNVRRKCILKK